MTHLLDVLEETATDVYEAPSTPLVQSMAIDEFIVALEGRDADGITSVCKELEGKERKQLTELFMGCAKTLKVF
jgi:hypothetical protein